MGCADRYRRRLPTDPHTHRNDGGDNYPWRGRVAQSHGLETPLSNRRHHSRVNILAHAAQEAGVLHVAAFIYENLDNRNSVEISDLQRAEVWRGVKELPRLIGVAPDTASGRGIDVAGGRRARGDRPLGWFLCPLTARGSECQPEPHAAPQIRTHVVFGHQMSVIVTTGPLIL